MINKYEIINTTPTIPAKVYENLPPFLKTITDQFDDQREKDVVLTGSLVILGGCFNGIKGKYDKDWVNPNLFAFIVAPAASGKGTMKYAKKLGNKIHGDFSKTNAELKADYAATFKKWLKQSRGKKSGGEKAPVKPKYPVLFIPGNSSAASIYKLLDESDGKAIICETEADSLTGAIKQDWGNFSHVLRCSFQHEPVTLSRSGDDLYLSIDHPCLSVLLTGTPDQVPRLIGSTEDGLFSRFIFYCYSRDMVWIDPTPCSECTDLTPFFEGLSCKVAEIKKQLDAGNFTFSLSMYQFGILSENFNAKTKLIKQFEGQDAASAIFRLGLIAFRIGMIFTVIRQMDDLNGKVNLECTDEDLNNALGLTDVYFEHTMVMHSLLPKKSGRSINPKMREFYSLLPKDKEFPRKESNEIGKSIGISEKTVWTYLGKLKDEGLLTNPNFGTYKKEQEE